MVSISEIYDAICDDRALKLFDAIATNGGKSGHLSEQLDLSRKEYYSRMSRLIKTGMVKRKNGTHFLTAFGEIVYDAQVTIKKAVQSYWKLKAIDSIDSSDEISEIERKNLLDTLLEDGEIKTILLQRIS
jgi:predicted transcriptional regulator